MMFRVGAEYVPFESVLTFELRSRTVEGDYTLAVSEEVVLHLKEPKFIDVSLPLTWHLVAQGEDALAIRAAVKDLHDRSRYVA
jgi:hypothetical protein